MTLGRSLHTKQQSVDIHNEKNVTALSSIDIDVSTTCDLLDVMTWRHITHHTTLHHTPTPSQQQTTKQTHTTKQKQKQTQTQTQPGVVRVFVFVFVVLWCGVVCCGVLWCVYVYVCVCVYVCMCFVFCVLCF